MENGRYDKTSSLKAFKMCTKYNKKRLLFRFIHYFKLDLNNNMDHMRILGTDPSLDIFSLTKKCKKMKVMPLNPRPAPPPPPPQKKKLAEGKRDDVINP